MQSGKGTVSDNLAAMVEFRYLAIDQLAPNPLHPRGTVVRKSLLELSDSIRKYGLLVPLIVAKSSVGFQIIAGERRLRAAKVAGLKEVPVIILDDISEKEMVLLALTENVLREPLNLLEQATAVKRLQEELGVSIQEIGERIGLAVSDLMERLELLNLPNQVKNAYLSKEISDREILDLARLEDPLEILEEFKRRKMSGGEF